MKTKIILAVVLAQVLVLGFMAGEREFISANGRTLFLRTAPVDPNDPMRGDYVRLQYEISTVPKELCSGAVRQWFAADARTARSGFRDRKVYAQLQVNAHGVAELVMLSDEKPESGPFLRGRVQYLRGDTVDVQYGIEALFMQQGKARAFENEVRGARAGVPVNMEVAVGGGGTAVLKGYRWESLGITVTMDPRPPRQNGQTASPRPGLQGLTVELKNHSDSPIAIVDRPAGGSFRLIRSAPRWGGSDERWQWIGENLRLPPAQPDQVRVLAPGERHVTHIDLTKPEWFVIERSPGAKNKAARPLSELAESWGAWFRVEYVGPTPADSVGLPHAGEIVHTYVRSRQFSPAGNAD